MISRSVDVYDLSEGFKAEYFDELAQLEERNFWFRARNRIIAWAFGKYAAPAGNVLEIGCGNGYVLRGLKETFPDAELNGSEIFLNGLQFAASRMPDVTLMQMDARDIPFTEHFDAIGMAVLNEDDLPDFGLKNPTTRTRAYDPCACGYFAQIGEDDSGRFVALSGLINPVGMKASLPSNGSAKYTGFTKIIALNRDAASDSLALAEAKGFSVVVRVDFDAGTFRGRTPNFGDKEYQLTFNGAMTGRDIQGKATLKKEGFDVTGPLKGRIDKKGVVSAFHGNNDVDAFAGGFGAGGP